MIRTRTNAPLKRFLITTATLLLVCLFVAGPVLAQGRGGRGGRGERSAQESIPKRPMIIESINVSAGTMKIMGTVYRVSEATRVFDIDGNRMRLSELRPRKGNDLGDMISFESRDSKNGAPLVREIRIVPVMMP